MVSRPMRTPLLAVLVFLASVAAAAAQPPPKTTPAYSLVSSWRLAAPKAPVISVTNPSSLGLNLDNQAGGSFHDYVIDGGGDSSILLQGATSGVRLSRIHITRTDAKPSVSWAAHGIYAKAANNTFVDIYLNNAGGRGISGISDRMRGNTFVRTVIRGYTHAVTYYEHDGRGGVTTFRDGDWTFSGDTAVWGDDSNEPPSPYIKQTFVFENVDVHGPSGAKFLAFGSSYGGSGLAYRGGGVTIRNCTINGRPVTAADVTGVPPNLLTIR